MHTLTFTISHQLVPFLFCVQVTKFIDLIASEGPTSKERRSYSLYGFTEATLDSLILSILPQESDEYTPLTDDQFTESKDIKQHILLTLIQALRENAKFNIAAVSIHLNVYYEEIHINLVGIPTGL